MVSPTGRTATVYQPDGAFDLIDLLLVTDLRFEPPVDTPAPGS